MGNDSYNVIGIWVTWSSVNKSLHRIESIGENWKESLEAISNLIFGIEQEVLERKKLITS